LTPTSLKIHELSIDERMRLVEDIWDSIAADQASLPLTSAQRQELDFRLDAYAKSSDPGIPALEAIEKIRKLL